MNTDETNVANSIKSALSADWDFSTGSLTVDIQPPNMAITAKAKAKNNGNASDLQTAVINAAKAYPQLNQVHVDPNSISAHANLE
jgi:hypothetical protein